MKLKILAGTTSRIMRVFIADSTSSSGAGLTGLVFNSAGLSAYYCRSNTGTPVVINLVTATAGTYTSSGFIQLDATNMPGIYEVHLPDAALAAGAHTVHIMLKGATNMMPVIAEIELDAVDYQTAAFGAVRPTVAGRTLLVNATGYVGLDWNAIDGKTATNAFTNTTVATTTNLTNLPAITSNWLTAAGVAAGALNGKGDWNTTVPPTAALIADAVWDELKSEHTSAGSFGASLVYVGTTYRYTNTFTSDTETVQITIP